MKKAIVTILCVGALLLSGCYNTFEANYRPNNSGLTSEILPYQGYTEVITTDDMSVDFRRLRQEGYVMIGSADFVDTTDSFMGSLQEHAQKIGADKAVYQGEFLGQEKRLVRQYRTRPGDTIVTQQTGVVDGKEFTQTKTITLPDRHETTYHTVVTSKYHHHATFWRKNSPQPLGVHIYDLPDDIRQTLERNTGAVVDVVVKNSPAFTANILKGDVIVAINEAPVLDANDLKQKLRPLAGMMATLTIYRGTKELKIPVKLRPLAYPSLAPAAY